MDASDTPDAGIDACVVGTPDCCAEGYANCGGGFCTNLASSYMNCGTCGTVCPSGLCTDGVCGADTCGDGIVDPGEACDGANFNGRLCGSAPFERKVGVLACTPDCSIDLSTCVECGGRDQPCCEDICGPSYLCVAPDTCAPEGWASVSSTGITVTLSHPQHGEWRIREAPEATSIPAGTYTATGVYSYDYGADTCVQDVGDPVSGTVTVGCGEHWLVGAQPPGNSTGNCGVVGSYTQEGFDCRTPCRCPPWQ